MPYLLNILLCRRVHPLCLSQGYFIFQKPTKRFLFALKMGLLGGWWLVINSQEATS
jgi:hypothetical protein